MITADTSVGAGEKALALFDFDGTITLRDTFLEFIHFATGRTRLLAGKIALGPLIVGYKLGLIPARSIRAAIARVAFAGVPLERLTRLGDAFARERIPPLVRSRAKEQIDWHRARGDRVVVVSASLDVYLDAWCRDNGLELICTRLERRGDRTTGRYLSGDCSGEEKRQRVLRAYNINDYALIYAYGDTDEDRDMLDLADHKFFRWVEIQ